MASNLVGVGVLILLFFSCFEIIFLNSSPFSVDIHHQPTHPVLFGLRPRSAPRTNIHKYWFKIEETKDGDASASSSKFDSCCWLLRPRVNQLSSYRPGIMGSFKALAWALLLLFIIIYVTGHKRGGPGPCWWLHHVTPPLTKKAWNGRNMWKRNENNILNYEVV